MFNKTKRKIVSTVVLSLLALMLVTLTTIFVTNRMAIRRQNENMLEEYVRTYSLEKRFENPEGEEPPYFPQGDFSAENETQIEPPQGNGPAKNEPMFRLSTFYSVAYSETGEVLKIENGNSNLQSESSLVEIASAILKSGKERGKSGDYFFRVEKAENYTLVALIDSTIVNNNQRTLILEMLVIGGVAMAILLIISVFIARRIVRPLEENDKKQRRFVSDAGHELKTPLAVISANSELLKRATGSNEWLSNIDYETGRMSELVGSLLDLSRAENAEAVRENLDLSKLVGGEVLAFESYAFEKGTALEADIEEGITAVGNRGQLSRLVSILLDNALSHGTGNKISVSLKSEKHSAVLKVTNEAEKIGDDELKRLFDRFYRSDEARNEEGSHYGLGLSIAKAVVSSHGGRIKAEYSDGKITFTVTLP